jgi:phosphatidylglycerophosphate synthase
MVSIPRKPPLSSHDHPQLLTIPHPETAADFGNSIAITPNGNVLVGAWNTNVNGAAFAGHAYLFDAVSGNLLLDIANPEIGQSSVFGWSVAAVADRIIVGAPAPGAVYVFESIPEPTSIVLAGTCFLLIVAICRVRTSRKASVRRSTL